MTNENYIETDTRYLKIIDEIKNRVTEIYNQSDRKDLIMLYEADGEKIYSYVYSEFLMDINPNTKDVLCAQYEKARKDKKIVLFIRDKKNKKFKSYTI